MTSSVMDTIMTCETAKLVFACVSPWINQTNEVDAAREAIDAGADFNIKLNNTNATILHLAVHCNRYELVEYLVTVPGIELNSRLKCGKTPFMIACDKGKLKMAKLLMSSIMNIPEALRKTEIIDYETMYWRNNDILKWLKTLTPTPKKLIIPDSYIDLVRSMCELYPGNHYWCKERQLIIANDDSVDM